MLRQEAETAGEEGQRKRKVLLTAHRRKTKRFIGVKSGFGVAEFSLHGPWSYCAIHVSNSSDSHMSNTICHLGRASWMVFPRIRAVLMQ